VNAAETDGTTLLMRAIHGRSPEIAKLLIDAGANASAANRYGVSALYLAARSTDAQTVQALLAAGADANGSLPEGETVLMTAAKTGSAEIVQALLGDSSAVFAAGAATSGYSSVSVPTGRENRADPNAKEGWHGQTALMWAAAEGHAEVVRLLIEAGADLNAADKEGTTALILATLNGHLDVAALLLDAGAGS